MLEIDVFIFFLMIRRPPRSTPKPSSAASDVYKRQDIAIAVTARQSLEKLSSSKSLEKPFKRTISRLFELTSKNY